MLGAIPAGRDRPVIEDQDHLANGALAASAANHRDRDGDHVVTLGAVTPFLALLRLLALFEHQLAQQAVDAHVPAFGRGEIVADQFGGEDRLGRILLLPARGEEGAMGERGDEAQGADHRRLGARAGGGNGAKEGNSEGQQATFHRAPCSHGAGRL